jgi:broad-specificity NMP kinase
MKICACGKGGSGKSTVVTLLANAAQEIVIPCSLPEKGEYLSRRRSKRRRFGGAYVFEYRLHGFGE